MSLILRVFVVLVSLAPVQASLNVERGMAEVWVCPGPDGTEAFADSGGPGCHQLGDSRPMVQQGGTGVKRIEVAPTGEFASINMQPMIALMKKLQSTTGHENDALMTEVEQQPGKYVPPVLMALGVAHFRQGHTAEALFWFNAGRLRAMYDAARCTDVSARSAVNALIYGTPRELIQAQFHNVARFRDTAAKVIQWDEATPQNYEYRWINFHGMGIINSALGNTMGAAGPLTVSQDQWSILAK